MDEYLTDYMRVTMGSTIPVFEGDDAEHQIDVLIPWILSKKKALEIAKTWVGKKNEYSFEAVQVEIISLNGHTCADYKWNEFIKTIK